MWDWVTFAICVGSVVPSVLLVGVLLRYLLKNSERRCFKGASEDCEILVSTSTSRPRFTSEVLHVYTHRQVLDGAASTANLQLTDSPPEYTAAAVVTAGASSLNTSAGDLSRNNSSHTQISPPGYGSQTSVLYSISSLYQGLPSRPLNLNVLITSMDLLPEFATLPPPPSYDESVRENHIRLPACSCFNSMQKK